MRLATALSLLALLAAPASAQTLVINEIDADTPGSDVAEFVELYNAGSEAVSLDGHVVVFFNGNGATSYAAFDLSGTLAAGDYYVLGNPGVPNVNQTFDPGSSGALQNGADAVGLYVGAAADFPSATAATTTDLIDAIAYDTDDADATDLLAALGLTVQYNENENGAKDNESIQRSPDGSDMIITAATTPGAANALITGPEMFTALLRGENEVPATDSDAKGGATAVLDGTSLTVTGRFAGLEGDYQAAHLHGGPAGVNGPVVVGLTATTDADLRGGTFEAQSNTFTVRSTFADSIRAGLVYVNVHSSVFPAGEIRGQLGTAIHTLPFALSGDNEVPPVTTDATGSGTVSLDGSTVTVTGTFSGLSSAYAASHLHGGAAGENGPVVQGLAPTVDADMLGGTFEAAMNTFDLRPSFADSIRSGLVYVNVHSATFGGGEIRGQVGVEAAGTGGTIADARAQGNGATVTVEGTVTRSMGDFTYFQDDTAGLAIRQTGGAFADSVASGAIAPGTTIRVTGTLSMFRELLQINGSALTSFEITGTADVPDPQVVTLAQLASNGEDFESELVTVQMVTIDAAGDTNFQPGTNYQITDASDATNAVSLRVPNENDTAVDGTMIPAVANVTAVVSQFSTTGANVGYQLLVVQADDVEEFTVANEDGPSAVLSLSIANPIQGAATVRFSLGAPGSAHVALYDVLGREVALLADRDVDATEQTATFDASGLATGTYVLRLTGEIGAITRTVTVVR